MRCSLYHVLIMYWRGRRLRNTERERKRERETVGEPVGRKSRAFLGKAERIHCTLQSTRIRFSWPSY